MRMSGKAEDYAERIQNAFGSVTFINAEGCDGEFGFITEVMKEGEYEAAAAKFENMIHMIRVAS